MKVESITFLSDLEDVNMDVIVELEDGHNYVVVVG